MKASRAALLATVLAILAPAAASGETVDRVVSAGKRSTVLVFSIYNSDTCSAGEIPKVLSLRQGAHGKADVASIRNTIKGDTCGNMQVYSQQVTYTPRAGFRGQDEIEVEFEFYPYVESTAATSRNFTIRIQVK